jgi:hypothetical protein
VIKWLLTLSLLVSLAAQAADPSFERGVLEYRAGRFSLAWGQFYNAANAGDPDAARVALHMLRYGPMLYDSHWDAGRDEVEFWQILALKASGRPLPAFRPPKYQQGQKEMPYVPPALPRTQPRREVLVNSPKPRPFNEMPAALPSLR